MRLLKQRAIELRRQRRKFWAVVGILCFVMLCCMGAAGWVGLTFTSSPRFCITCHFMQPYYDSWKTSKHKDVTCTDCHFEPGLRSYMKGKFLGLAQLVKYVTSTQGSRPAAEIADESCLRSGCHDTRLLPAKTLRESWVLLDDDIRDWASFCSTFSEQNGTDSPSFVKRMAELMPADTLAAIKTGARTSGPPEEAKARIVAALNIVLQRQGLYKKECFAGVSVPDEVEGFVKAVPGSLGRKQTERLNRLLLEMTFPEAVRDSQLFKGAPFDHIKHMETERRGKKLRCVSCHSQIVQGAHMVVTETTCFLCHFKEQPFNDEQGKCATCHETPTKTVVRNGVEFNHATVKDREIPCAKCHFNISRGQGLVDKERCHICHNRQADLDRYDDTDFVHTNHITKHKVECLHCHTAVEHSLQPYEAVAKLNCEDCHPKHHEKVGQLYMAKKVKGLPKLEKSTHFTARVTCQTCHVEQQTDEGRIGDIRRASRDVCVECHREGYDKMFDNWHWAMTGYTNRLGKLREMTKKAVAKPGEDIDEDDLDEAKDYFKEGNRLFSFIEQAVGAHNIGHAKKLLFDAQESLQESMSLLSEDYLPGNELKMLETDIEPGCTFTCHTGVERIEKAKYKDKDFKHGEHITKHELTCTKCHADEKDYTKKHGKAQMDMEDQLCLDCHEKEKKKAEAADAE